MKIKTDREWDLKLIRGNGWVEIKELHHGSDHNNAPYIDIPVESIDKVILYLIEARKKFIDQGLIEGGERK